MCTKWSTFFIALGVVVIMSALLIVAVNQKADGVYLAPATVKLETGDGHGTAFHIGDGYFLTAAHVVDGKENLLIRPDGVQARVAETLMLNSGYDVALLRADHTDVGVMNVDCNGPIVGSDVELKGNPIKLEHVSSFGKVAGVSREIKDFVNQVTPVNATMLPGMSGGPAVNSFGDAVGINSAVMLMPTFMPVTVPTGFGFIVPMDVVCGLFNWD